MVDLTDCWANPANPDRRSRFGVAIVNWLQPSLPSSWVSNVHCTLPASNVGGRHVTGPRQCTEMRDDLWLWSIYHGLLTSSIPATPGGHTESNFRQSQKILFASCILHARRNMKMQWISYSISDQSNESAKYGLRLICTYMYILICSS